MAATGARISKRSVTIAGHRTSVSLETAFWDELQRIAAIDGLSFNALVSRIDSERDEQHGNLSARLRVYVLEWLKRNPDR
ncbi:MAG: ribbon-helix-helix domain-containing protein [Acetobacterales bacterium]